MCTASGDVGWFLIKHKSQGQHLYVKHGNSVQRFLASRFTPCTVPLYTHTCTQTSSQQVVWDKSLNSSTLTYGLRMHVAGWSTAVITLFTLVFLLSCISIVFLSTKLLYYSTILNTKLQTQFTVPYITHYPPRREATDPITATNNSIVEVSSVKNMTG